MHVIVIIHLLNTVSEKQFCGNLVGKFPKKNLETLYSTAVKSYEKFDTVIILLKQFLC